VLYDVLRRGWMCARLDAYKLHVALTFFDRGVSAISFFEDRACRVAAQERECPADVANVPECREMFTD
jgi:hypothetical protein